MALNASTNWYVRAGGNALNGGGWDAAIAGAGINYADADAAILSPTDLATSGAVATVTSAAGGFTANMVGNCLRIASGTNFTPGYYFIVTFTDANTVILDRACATAAGSGGAGRIGGAFATPWGSLSNGGSVAAPSIASPLADGHVVNIRGAGTDDPSVVDYAQGDSYAQYPSGSEWGKITFKGYNGRPLISAGMAFHVASANTRIVGLGFRKAGATYPTYGLVNGSAIVVGCRFDQAGYDTVGVVCAYMLGCEFVNTGSSAAGVQPAIVCAGFLHGSRVFGWRGYAYTNGGWTGGSPRVTDCIFAACRATSAAVQIINAWGYAYQEMLQGCTVANNAGDGVHVHGATTYDADAATGLSMLNCIIAGNGGYGLNVTGTASRNELGRRFIDHNAWYNNALGNTFGFAIGENDILLSADPFTDAPGGDFTLNSAAGGGALIRDVAFPADFPSS